MNKRFAVFFIILILYSGKAYALEKVSVQLKWFHEFNFAGYYAALEKGFYQESGLDVTIKEGKPGLDFVEEVVSGRANYGVEMPELLIKHCNGQPVIVLAAIFQHSPQILLARADSGIKSPHNLVNKKVMWRSESAAELKAMIVNEGIDISQVHISELSWNIEDLISGKIDAIHAYRTDQPWLLEKKGIETIQLAPINYGIDFYGDCLFTSEKELRDHPERVKAFKKATLRGWSYAMNNPEELIEIIKNKYNAQSSREFLKNEYLKIREIMLPDLVEIGYMNKGRWKHIGDTYVKLGLLDSDYSLEGFIYDPDPHKDTMRMIKALSGAFLLVSLIALILYYFNRKLNKNILIKVKMLRKEIQERKRIEKKLRESEKLMSFALEGANDGIWDFNLQNGKYYMSNRGCKILGYDPGEINENNGVWYELVHPEDIQLTQELLEKHLQGKTELFEVEQRLKMKSGDWKWILTRGKAIEKDDDGKPLRMTGTHTDISLKKETEKEKELLQAQLMQAQKMEAIGTLAGGIAHDFNNVLAVILGYAELIELDAALSDRNKAYLKNLISACERAKYLIKQILTYARKETDEKRPIKLNNVLKEALEFIKATIPTNIEIKEDLDNTCGSIFANETQINQVIINLCANAFHAMEKNGGTLELSLQKIEIFDTGLKNENNLKPGSYFLITIKDNGPGIDRQIIDRIFDPYFTTKETGKGSGMGLAIVSGILKNHNGKVTVESEPGEGTIFKVFLPEVEAKEQKPEVQIGAVTGGNENILVVDDEENIATVTKEILSSLGYNVKAFTNSVKALESFRNDPSAFDVVVTDQAMPQMTGTGLAEKLLAIRPDLPIIICTGHRSYDDEEKASLIGISAFLTKPVDSKNLATAIRQVLDKK